MNPGDSHENSQEDRMSLILQVSDPTDTQEEDSTAASQAGYSGVDPSNAGGTMQSYQANLPVEEESGSEEDSDMERDMETLQSPALEVSPTERQRKIQSESLSKQNSAKSRKRSGRTKGKISIEEIIQRQEAASQIHNENERYRRKELRSALLGLRNQLTRPTKRPAVKLVLEAAIQELKELKQLERENAKQVETLKDKEKRLTFELENKLKEYKQFQKEGPTPATPSQQVVASPSYPAVPQMPATWFPIFSPSQSVPTLEPSSVAHRPSPTVPPLFINPWSIPRLPPQQVPSPTLNFGVPILSSVSPTTLTQAPAVAQRLNINPLIPTLFPFQPPAAVTPRIPFPPHGALPVVQRLVTPSEASAVERPGQQQVFTLLSPGPRVFSLPSQHSTASSHLGIESVERTRVITATSTPQETGGEHLRANERSREDGRRSSKNGEESADTQRRPSIVVHYTTSADSETGSAKQGVDGHDVDSNRQKNARREHDTCRVPAKAPVVVEILEQPILSLRDNLTPPKMLSPPTTFKRPIHTEREIPPLLKISDNYLRNRAIDADKELRGPVKKIKTNSSPRSDVVNVEWYNNPFFKLTQQNQRAPTKLKNGYNRKRRCSSTADTDSSASEEDTFSYSRSPPLRGESQFQTHQKSVACPGE